MRSLASMHLLMLYEARWTGEAEAADVTRVGPFTCMHAFVNLFLPHCREGMVAKLAPIPTHPDVDMAACVVFKTFPREEHPGTLWARETWPTRNYCTDVCEIKIIGSEEITFSIIVRQVAVRHASGKIVEMGHTGSGLAWSLGRR